MAATPKLELDTQAITNSASGTAQPYVGYSQTVGAVTVSSTQTFGEGSTVYGVPGYASTTPNINLVISDNLVTKYGSVAS
jgi:hypothetical protein